MFPGGSLADCCRQGAHTLPLRVYVPELDIYRKVGYYDTDDSAEADYRSESDYRSDDSDSNPFA